MIGAIVLSVLVMALGDAGLHPSLRRVQAGDAGAVKAARRWALAGLLLAVAALGLMTRAPYSRA